MNEEVENEYAMPADLVAEHMALLEQGSPIIEPWAERLRGPNGRRPPPSLVAFYKRRAARIFRVARTRLLRPPARARRPASRPGDRDAHTSSTGTTGRRTPRPRCAMNGERLLGPHAALVAASGLGPTLAGALLELVVDALERDPELARRLRGVLLPEAPAARPSEPFMNVCEYARHARVSERTVRHLLKEMTEGSEFHRDGRTGRRVIVHTEAADAWRRSRSRAPNKNSGTARQSLVIDEVLRRRAKAALKKTGTR